MYDNELFFWGIPIEEITRDVKDGKFILKTQGNINNDVKAQTVIVYGNVTGPIEANQVVIINGDATGNVRADNIAKLESKEKKTCKSCKYYTEENCIPSLFYCEEKKSCDTCKYHQRLSKYRHFFCCDCDNSTKEIKCEKYQKKENPAK